MMHRAGNEVITETQEDRDLRATLRVPRPVPQAAVVAASEAVAHDAEYVTVQHLAPYAIGLLRGVYLGVFGAIGGLLTGLQMGSREWDQLLWGMVIGFCLGFLGRGAEAVIIDTPKTTSTTEKI
jgi:hypothetical protein